MAAFSALIIEAGLIDYYATSVQGISDWCMSPAYWFLIPTYGSLWLVGRWFAHAGTAMEGKGLTVFGLGSMGSQQFRFRVFQRHLLSVLRTFCGHEHG